MTTVFIKLLNMSITASWLVIAVILLRILLKRAPKWITVVLWGGVAIRLICPFSLESIFSLIPSTETIPQNISVSENPVINSGLPILNQAINPILSESFAPNTGGDSVNPMQVVTSAASVIWIIGVVSMLLYTLVSLLRIRRKVRESVHVKDNIWICDHISTPFILGVIRPRIYLSSSIAEADKEYVISHEQAHLKRKDHIWKPLGFLLLSIYWFNPILWAAYILLCKDIEFACDEKVLRKFGAEIKKPYAHALINCSVPRKMISACPLAFGEVGVKKRVKNVLSYKKPAFWIVLLALIACIVAAVCLLTNPESSIRDNKSTDLISKMEEDLSLLHIDFTPAVDVPNGLSNEKAQYIKINNFGGITVYRCNTAEEAEKIASYISSDGQSITIPNGETTQRSHYDWIATPHWYLYDHFILCYIGNDHQIINYLTETFGQCFAGGTPDGSPVETVTLKQKYPEYFGLDDSSGLIVYVWQTSKSSYFCALESAKFDPLTDKSFAFVNGTSIAEMRGILTSYSTKQIEVTPVINPLSGYSHTIDESYKSELERLFWETEGHPNVFHTDK